MAPDIPGFYWDPDKNRYFKIQAAKTAVPDHAPWSSASVKRRLSEAEAAKKVRRRKHQVQRNIKRSPARDLWTFSGPLEREVEGARWMREGDVQTMGWAMGLEEKGGMRFGDDRGDGVHLGEFLVEEWVDSRKKGIVWATTDEKHIQCAGMQTNSNGYVRATSLDYNAPDQAPTTFPRALNVFDQISSINYDAHREIMLITTREPHIRPTYHISKVSSQGTASFPVVLDKKVSHRRPFSTNTLAVAPSDFQIGSQNYGYLGTDNGVVPVPLHYAPSYHDVMGAADRRISSEIFAIDFQPVAGGGFVFAAGRAGSLYAMDPRGNHSTTYPLGHHKGIAHGSPVSNMKFVSQYHVLAAGPRSKMALYDIRCIRPGKDPRITAPVVTFPGYTNQARLDTGLAVSPDGHTVVAAQDDGNVKVFSVSSGTEVACPALDGIGAGSVVRKMTYGRRSGDLYIGLGGSVRKFGFGSNRVDVV